MKMLTITSLILLSVITASADQPVGEKAQVFVSEHFKRVIFCMIPGTYEYGETRKVIKEPSGVAYKLEADGSLKVLYKTKGWYSNEVLVSMDAQYLVRMGPWCPGRRLSKNHVAVEFYKNGKLLKSYSTIDLVVDHKKIQPTVNHYFWRGKTCKLEPNHKFTLDTIDGIRYVFDTATGKITSKTKIKN